MDVRTNSDAGRPGLDRTSSLRGRAGSNINLVMQPSDIAIPTLPSRSVEATLEFYRKLGFDGKIWGAPYQYAILTRGTLEIHFFTHSTLLPEESSVGCYLRVADVDGLHRAFAAAQLPGKGVPRMDAPEDKPWGMREFAVVDPDGNLLRIGRRLER